MTITNTYRWTGKLGSNWNALVPAVESNWEQISDPSALPAFPEGAGDLAVFDLGNAISVTAKTEEGDSGIGSAEEIQVVAGSDVTFNQDFFSVGADGSGGLIIDEDATLTLAQNATMVSEGSLDILGLTSGATLVVEPNSAFRDENLYVGGASSLDDTATGVVSVDQGLLFVVQSAPGSADGVMKVGESGAGSIDVTNGSTLYSASAILGLASNVTGKVTIDDSNWIGNSLNIGQSGTGIATIASGSTVVFTSGVIGDAGNGAVDVTGGSQFMVLFETLGAQSGSVGNATLDDSIWTGVSLDVGAVGTGNVTIESGATVSILSSALIGDTGDGSIDVTNASSLVTASATLGAQSDSTGFVTLDDSIWSGDSLVVGNAGTGSAAIRSGSTVAFTSVSIGPDGEVGVTGTPTASSQLLAPSLTLNFGTIDVSAKGQVLMGATSGVDGAIAIQGGSSLVGLGTANSDVSLTNGGVVQAVLAIPGALTINGNISGTGTLEPTMTLEVNGGIGTGVDILFGPSVSDAVGDLMLDVPGANLGTIVGFGNGNIIDIQGSRYTDAVFTPGGTATPGTLTLSGNSFTPLSFAIEGTYSPHAFSATPGDTDTIVTLCFVSGTFIETEFGEVEGREFAGRRSRALR